MGKERRMEVEVDGLKIKCRCKKIEQPGEIIKACLCEILDKDKLLAKFNFDSRGGTIELPPKGEATFREPQLMVGPGKIRAPGKPFSVDFEWD